MNLKNKTALVTGGNSGLGFEIVKQLVKNKCKVIILGKDGKKVKAAKKKLKSSLVSTLTCNLQDFSQIEQAVKKTKNIDILINCAGIIAYQPLEIHDPQNIKDIVEVNLLGTIYMTRAILPKMKKKNSGTIINISSTSGLMTGGHPNESVYIASKHGVTGFTHALKKEIDAEKSNINILGFYPGGMNTRLFSKSGLDQDTSKFMDPAEIAKIIIFILERPDSIKMDHVLVNRDKNL
ncbi:SDR family oxidoreductase [Patescibacteria group bacterium]|nr:SDR family oxidoreductase [Patescibacteria group bacterium]MBU1931189.1 SDR family oxidoreductase [Patescibacteria group bacterium]